MIRRTTAILGAGTVLDFDFNGLILPTTSNITKEVVVQKIKDLDDKDSLLIKTIFELIVETTRNEYLNFHPAVRHYEPYITFEDLFEVIETLYSYSGTWNHERYPFSLISTLVRSDLNYDSVVYYRAMVSMIEKIVEIVKAYDMKFQDEGRELWYKDFWKRFNGRLDVFNLNYDTTIENSLDEYNDGFVDFTQKYKRFDPATLWNCSKDVTTINHLHGCILYGDVNPKPAEYYYSHRDLYKFFPDSVDENILSRQWEPRNQVGDLFYYSPIITGLKKTDKICFLPHSIYHANLVKKILENPSLLICGYSFGDLYVNQLLQRHKLIHGENERIIIVDKWPEYVNESQVRLYRYFKDNGSSGLKEFVERIIEGGINTLEKFKSFIQLDAGCWQDPNGVLRLYTQGFRRAVDCQKDCILYFLQGL